jgi:hypothetical protein
MDTESDRREEKRLQYSWPLWFGYNETGEFLRGQVVDLSSNIVSFTIPENRSPRPGSHVLTRFSYPLASEVQFDMASYYDWSEVIRVDQAWDGKTRVAMRLHQSLECELPESEFLACSA